MTKASKFLVFAILFLAAKAVADEFKECPQVIELLKAQGTNNWLDHKTEAIEIQIQVMLTTLN
jgi:hypothetical protein